MRFSLIGRTTRGEITSFGTVHNVANTKQSSRRTSRRSGRRAEAEIDDFSHGAELDSRDRRGPSQSLVAWRRFLLESLLCLVLIGVIVLASVRELGGILIGPFIVTVAFAIVGIVRYER
jgi:hypothetical protein